MTEDDVTKGSSARLSELLSLDEGGEKLWGHSDLASLLQHQMRSPLLFDLERTESANAGTLAGLTRVSAVRLETFEDLSRHPSPPIELLRVFNRFAKARGHAGAPLLPQDIASVLYYLSIALALVRCGERITGLTDEALGQGMDWVVARRWVSSELKAICNECKAMLSASDAT